MMHMAALFGVPALCVRGNDFDAASHLPEMPHLFEDDVHGSPTTPPLDA